MPMAATSGREKRYEFILPGRGTSRRNSRRMVILVIGDRGCGDDHGQFEILFSDEAGFSMGTENARGC